MALHERLDAQPMEDGKVCCPRCERFVGKLTDGEAQYYCTHCKVEVIVATEYSARIQNDETQIQMKASKSHMLAVMAAANLRAHQNNARLIEEISKLPDAPPDNPLSL